MPTQEHVRRDRGRDGGRGGPQAQAEPEVDARETRTGAVERTAAAKNEGQIGAERERRPQDLRPRLDGTPESIEPLGERPRTHLESWGQPGPDEELPFVGAARAGEERAPACVAGADLDLASLQGVRRPETQRRTTGRGEREREEGGERGSQAAEGTSGARERLLHRLPGASGRQSGRFRYRCSKGTYSMQD